MPDGDQKLEFTVSGKDAGLEALLAKLMAQSEELQKRLGNFGVNGSGGLGGGGGGASNIPSGSAAGVARSSSTNAAPSSGGGGRPNVPPPVSHPGFSLGRGAQARGDGGQWSGGYYASATFNQAHDYPAGPGAVNMRSMWIDQQMNGGGGGGSNWTGRSAVVTEPDNGSNRLTYGERYGLNMLRGGLYAAANSGAQYYAAETQAGLTGRHDPMEQAKIGGGLVGGLAGAAIGSLFPGYGTIIGASVGNQVGTMFAANRDASEVRMMQLAVGGQAAAALSQGWNNAGPRLNPGTVSEQGWGAQNETGYVTSPLLAGAERLANHAKYVQGTIRKLYRGQASGYQTWVEQMTPTAEEMAGGYSGVYGAMIAGGINPDEKITMPDYQTTTRRSGRGYDEQSTTLVNATGPRFSQVTGDAWIKYLREGGNVLKNAMNPILAASVSTGGNIADIASQFGAVNTYEYLDVMAGLGNTPSVTMRQLQGMGTAMQHGQRQIGLDSTQARNVGRNTGTDLALMMSAVGDIPDGKNSLIYAQLNEKKRAAMLTQFGEEDDAGYGLQAAKLGGMRERANYLPFAPGNIFSMDMQSMKMNSSQISTISGRMNNMRSSGDLSEASELSMTKQIEALKTQNAAIVAQLSEGMENRLPAMSSGRPSFFGRYNSFQLAALNVGMMGSPMSGFGAYNGGQRQHQLDFIRSYGGGDMHSNSTSSVMNSAGKGGASPDIAAALNNIASALNRLSGMGGSMSGIRPGAQMNNANANLNQSNTGFDRISGSSN